MKWKKIVAIIREKHRDSDFPGTGESCDSPSQTDHASRSFFILSNSSLVISPLA